MWSLENLDNKVTVYVITIIVLLVIVFLMYIAKVKLYVWGIVGLLLVIVNIGSYVAAVLMTLKDKIPVQQYIIYGLIPGGGPLFLYEALMMKRKPPLPPTPVPTPVPTLIPTPVSTPVPTPASTSTSTLTSKPAPGPVPNMML